jgi:hypothetical protein
MSHDAADAVFSKLIRKRDDFTCQLCGDVFVSNPSYLDCAHMFSRGKLATRFDPENAVALCHYKCHPYLDGSPRRKRKFFCERLGEGVFVALELRSNQTVKQ